MHTFQQGWLCGWITAWAVFATAHLILRHRPSIRIKIRRNLNHKEDS